MRGGIPYPKNSNNRIMRQDVGAASLSKVWLFLVKNLSWKKVFRSRFSPPSEEEEISDFNTGAFVRVLKAVA